MTSLNVTLCSKSAVDQLCSNMLKDFKTSWDSINSSKCTSQGKGKFDPDELTIFDTIKKELIPDKSWKKFLPYILVAITLGLMIVSIVQRASVDKSLPETDKSEAATNVRNTTNIVLFMCVAAFILACVYLFVSMRK